MAGSIQSHKQHRHNSLKAERLREVLHYDPETGAWTWRVVQSHATPGKQAGGFNSYSYLRIGVDGRRYIAAQLAFLYITGDWPVTEIDHIDGDPRNTKWSNLRPATHQQNMLNRKRPSHNKSGVKGVFWSASVNKWQARIGFKGKQLHIGFFATLADAKNAMRDARPRIHGEFTRHD